MRDRSYVTAECQFGFCYRCPDPTHCQCKCEHMSEAEKAEQERLRPVQAAADTYNRKANELRWKPGYLNLKKVDHTVLFRAARVCRDTLPEESKLLRAEAIYRVPNNKLEKARQHAQERIAGAGTVAGRPGLVSVPPTPGPALAVPRAVAQQVHRLPESEGGGS